MNKIKFIHFKVAGYESNLKVDADEVELVPSLGEFVTIRMADNKIFSGMCTNVHINYETASIEFTITLSDNNT